MGGEHGIQQKNWRFKMTWHDAFLTQAHSDYSVFMKLNESRFPLCHKLHYLQMATEKLAKVFQCEKRNTPPPKTHLALLKMLKIIKGRQEIQKQLEFKHKKSYKSYIDSLMSIAEQIQNLAPVGGDFEKLNQEYPWENPIGRVNCPAKYNYTEIKTTDLNRFKKLIVQLFQIKGISVNCRKNACK